MSQTRAATMTTFVILTTMLTVATVVSGQGASPPTVPGEMCGANLAVCTAALRGAGGGTKPPKECCDGLETAVKTQLPCLCAILTNPQVLAGLNITVETALLIPASCGIAAGPSMCEAKAPLPHVDVAEPVPGPPENDKAAATKLAGTGLVGFILTAISMMF